VAARLMGLWVRILPGRSDNQQQVIRMVRDKVKYNLRTVKSRLTFYSRKGIKSHNVSGYLLILILTLILVFLWSAALN